MCSLSQCFYLCSYFFIAFPLHLKDTFMISSRYFTSEVMVMPWEKTDLTLIWPPKPLKCLWNREMWVQFSDTQLWLSGICHFVSYTCNISTWKGLILGQRRFSLEIKWVFGNKGTPCLLEAAALKDLSIMCKSRIVPEHASRNKTCVALYTCASRVLPSWGGNRNVEVICQ